MRTRENFAPHSLRSEGPTGQRSPSQKKGKGALHPQGMPLSKRHEAGKGPVDRRNLGRDTAMLFCCLFWRQGWLKPMHDSRVSHAERVSPNACLPRVRPGCLLLDVTRLGESACAFCWRHHSIIMASYRHLMALWLYKNCINIAFRWCYDSVMKEL